MFTIIDQGRSVSVAAEMKGDRVVLAPADLTHATGWEVKREGLCRGEVCVPVRDSLLQPGRPVDLSALAAALRRPLALDLDESAAYLGTSADDRGAELNSHRAPDFTLPDLDGRPHSLSDHRGRKVLLVFYASW